MGLLVPTLVPQRRLAFRFLQASSGSAWMTRQVREFAGARRRSQSLPADLDTIEERLTDDQHRHAASRLLGDGFTMIDASSRCSSTRHYVRLPPPARTR
jgi:hypothetical protein